MHKIKARELTAEHLGERIIHTDELGTVSSRVLTGISHRLTGTKLNSTHSSVKAYYQVVTLGFMDGTKRTVAATESLSLEEGHKIEVKEPGKTGLR